jgi:hypothetical protein
MNITKTNQKTQLIDAPTMRKMTIEEFKDYIEDGLMYINHHDVLCSLPDANIIACNQEQIEALIEYLNKIKLRLHTREELI